MKWAKLVLATMLLSFFVGCKTGGGSLAIAPSPESEVQVTEEERAVSAADSGQGLVDGSGVPGRRSGESPDTATQASSADQLESETASSTSYADLIRPKQMPLSEYKPQLKQPKTVDPGADRLFQNPPSEERRMAVQAREERRRKMREARPAAQEGAAGMPVLEDGLTTAP